MRPRDRPSDLAEYGTPASGPGDDPASFSVKGCGVEPAALLGSSYEGASRSNQRVAPSALIFQSPAAAERRA